MCCIRPHSGVVLVEGCNFTTKNHYSLWAVFSRPGFEIFLESRDEKTSKIVIVNLTNLLTTSSGLCNQVEVTTYPIRETLPNTKNFIRPFSLTSNITKDSFHWGKGLQKTLIWNTFPRAPQPNIFDNSILSNTWP